MDNQKFLNAGIKQVVKKYEALQDVNKKEKELYDGFINCIHHITGISTETLESMSGDQLVELLSQ